MTCFWIALIAFAIIGYFICNTLTFGEWYAERVLNERRFGPPKLSEIAFQLFLGSATNTWRKIETLAQNILKRLHIVRPQVEP